jgi:hypothetical protein
MSKFVFLRFKVNPPYSWESVLGSVFPQPHIKAADKMSQSLNLKCPPKAQLLANGLLRNDWIMRALS